MTPAQLAATIDAVTDGNKLQYAKLTGISNQQLHKLLTGVSGMSQQTVSIAALLLLCKQHNLLDDAKKALHLSHNAI